MGDGDLVFWVFFLLALMPVAAATGWLVGGVRRRRPPRPLPGLWWVCSTCRSVNAPDRPRCYACAAPIPAAPLLLPTARDFSVVQRFGPERPVEEVSSVRPPATGASVITPPEGARDGTAPPPLVPPSNP